MIIPFLISNPVIVILSLIVVVHNGFIYIENSHAYLGGIVIIFGSILIEYFSFLIYVNCIFISFLFLFPIIINSFVSSFTGINVFPSSNSSLKQNLKTINSLSFNFVYQLIKL